jgi:molybdopterin molybdotransferase
MRIGISLEEAQQLVLNIANPVGECITPLQQAAGRVLSRDTQSPINVPAFDKSPLDGYAVRAEDTGAASPGSPVVLQIIEEVRAGSVPSKVVGTGEAVRIMTGAPIPQGANEVVRFEDVQEAPDHIRVSHPLTAGRNIIPLGEDVVRGEVVAHKGVLINSALLGVLASLGTARIPVYNRVRVAIITTGNELLDPTEKWLPGKIYNSNRYCLEARCRELGTEPVFIASVPDEKEAIAKILSSALDEADVVITTGGVSVGQYDVVKDAIQMIGAETLFWKIAMKPGTPAVAAHLDGKPIISLSGNPAAAMVVFELVAVPVLKKMSGFRNQLPITITGVLAGNFTKASPQRRIVRARWMKQGSDELIQITGSQGNGVLKSLVDCNLLVDVPAGSPPLAAGQVVSAFLVDDFQTNRSCLQEPSAICNQGFQDASHDDDLGQHASNVAKKTGGNIAMKRVCQD